MGMSFKPNSKWNILITLTESDTGSSDAITFPKELIETRLFPLWSSNPFVLHANYVEMVDLFEWETRITTTLTMKKEQDGSFKLYGWSSIQTKKFQDRRCYWILVG